ncbi:LuxR C-terminal-related transcriptional regulator [Planobispora longispora]|uniref:LuxR family transcriptional regulator n=1 Tax=Planobispora longispora TaxID=28887 RepID=A0A8J3W2U1_9ACTN|nr:LuxR family transcriptional regulator [Planobispora longispora]GIH74117.1 LuxR family transcriptional regulator [Planobispora longispora]
MGRPWPFAGRTTQLAQIGSAAGGIVVAGAAGVGKSRLVAQAVRDLGGVAWVRATAAAAEIPFGAFAHLLPPAPPKGNPLGWAAAALGAPVLVVDDGHLLDAVSAALVHHLAAQERARVIVTVRGDAPAPDAVRALWKDDLLPRLDLAPLSPEDVAGILTEALGGRTEPETVERLCRVSGGNALYLRELVLSGVLEESGGLWRWGGSASMTPSLRETVAARIGELAADERRVLELLAYGEPLGADLLAAMVGVPAVERLEDRRLVTVTRDGRRLQVRLAHPLHGEVIRSGCGLLRERATLRELAEAVSAAGMRRREDVLRVAVWRLDGGQAGDPRLLTAACERARAVRDLALAARLGRAAVAAGGGPRAHMTLGWVLHYSDRYDEAEEEFLAAWERGLDDESRADCGLGRAFNLGWGLGRTAEALELFDETYRLISDRAVRQGVRLTRAALEAFTGDLARARASLAEAARMGPYEVPRGVLAAGAVEANLLALEGRARESWARVQEMLAGKDALEGRPGMVAALMDTGVLAALTLGDLAGAERCAEAGHRLHGGFGQWNDVIVRFGARRAQVLRLRGRVAEAAARCRDIAARLPSPSVFAGPWLGELAHAQALLGEAEKAEETLAAAGDAALPVGPAVVLPLESARVWTLAARGDVAGAVEAALAAAEGAPPPHALFLLHDAVRLGRADLVAGRLAGLGVEGPLASLFARHAAARDPARLDEVSRDFEGLGMTLYAAETAAQAATLYREAGRSRAETAARTRAAVLAGRCQGARTAALVGLDAPHLTPRQREIATLAAQGMSNREIAERLVVSVRTVANTLYSVYEKVGVGDRAELARILGIT